MSRLMFVYLSGSEKGKTRIYKQDHVTLGTADSCDLRLVPEEGGSLPDGVLADVYDDDGIFHLVPREAQNEMKVDVNGEAVSNGASQPSGHELRDGDTIRFGQGLSSASVLFQVMPENFSTASLAPREAAEADRASAQAVHPLTATLFVKELSASLWAEIPQRAKKISLAVVSVIVGLALVSLGLGLITLIRNTNKTDRLAEQLSNIE